MVADGKSDFWAAVFSCITASDDWNKEDEINSFTASRFILVAHGQDSPLPPYTDWKISVKCLYLYRTAIVDKALTELVKAQMWMNNIYLHTTYTCSLKCTMFRETGWHHVKSLVNVKKSNVVHTCPSTLTPKPLQPWLVYLHTKTQYGPGSMNPLAYAPSMAVCSTFSWPACQSLVVITLCYHQHMIPKYNEVLFSHSTMLQTHWISYLNSGLLSGFPQLHYTPLLGDFLLCANTNEIPRLIEGWEITVWHPGSELSFCLLISFPHFIHLSLSLLDTVS